MEIGPGTDRRGNSAQRLAGLWHAMQVPAELTARLGSAGGPVLVVDDLIDTGWTMAVASKLLRDAGAHSVLPFALATTS